MQLQPAGGPLVVLAVLVLEAALQQAPSLLQPPPEASASLSRRLCQCRLQAEQALQLAGAQLAAALQQLCALQGAVCLPPRPCPLAPLQLLEEGEAHQAAAAAQAASPAGPATLMS